MEVFDRAFKIIEYNSSFQEEYNEKRIVLNEAKLQELSDLYDKFYIKRAYFGQKGIKKWDNITEHCYFIFELDNGKYFKYEMGEDRQFKFQSQLKENQKEKKVKLCQVTLTEVEEDEISSSRVMFVNKNRKNFMRIIKDYYNKFILQQQVYSLYSNNCYHFCKAVILDVGKLEYKEQYAGIIDWQHRQQYLKAGYQGTKAVVQGYLGAKNLQS